MTRTLDTEKEQEDVKNTVHCLVKNLDGLPKWFEALCTEEIRIELIEHGYNQAKIFLEYVMYKIGPLIWLWSCIAAPDYFK